MIKKLGLPTLIVILALGMRLWYMAQGIDDFWGDSYHHWLISRLTVENRWVYSDYKGMNLVWLPVYHYLSALAMWLCGRYDLAPLHWLNLMLGTVSCYLVFHVARRLYNTLLAGLMAGLIMVFNHVHLVFSNLNMTEGWAATLLLLAIYCVEGLRHADSRAEASTPKSQTPNPESQGQKHVYLVALCVIAFLTTLTRYEMVVYLPPLAYWLYRRKKAWAVLFLASIGLALTVWAGWIYGMTGNPLTGWLEQAQATRWEHLFISGSPYQLLNLLAFFVDYRQAFPLLGVAFVGVALSLLSRTPEHQPHNPTLALIASMVGLHFLSLSIGFWAGEVAYTDVRFSVPDLPLLALLMPTWLSLAGQLSIRWRERLALGAGLIVFGAVVPLGLAAPALDKVAYIIVPEKEAGLFLKEQPLDGGTIWCDAPVSIYYSTLPLDSFVSSDSIEDYMATSEFTEAGVQAIETQGIKYLLYEHVSYNGTYWFFPQLKEGQEFAVGGFRLTPIYTFQGWETQYGAHPTAVWQIRPETEAVTTLERN